MPNPKMVSLVGTCPKCGESIELVISKKHAKIIFKSFKVNIQQAQLSADKVLQLDYSKLAKV